MFCHRASIVVMVFAASTTVFGQKAKDNPKAPKIVPAASYECLLGVYSNNGKATPFVNLAVPNGSNLLTDEVLSAMRGEISLGEISYIGKGYINVPENGTYEIDCTLGTVIINGRAMKFNRRPGTIDLNKGIYELDVRETDHGQPYLAKGKVTVRLAGTAKTVPVVNSGRDIQKFLNSSIEGVQVIPVSKFDFDAAQIDSKPAKGK